MAIFSHLFSQMIFLIVSPFGFVVLGIIVCVEILLLKSMLTEKK
jgi:hypothetical protein